LGRFSNSNPNFASFGRVAMAILLGAICEEPLRAQFAPVEGTSTGLPETIEAIEKARVTTRILYVTAHPDDESAAVLTYLARGLHADVALFSLTRGEGGQNDLGPEQAPQLGLIRTQELLAATRGYGVKLFFTHAPDFGFSKTPEETEKIWGDQVVDDMVRVIRMFRPTVVINNFGGVHGGHGHHQAAGLLTPKAVALAADASYKLKETPPSSDRSPGTLFDTEASAPWGDRRPAVLLDLDRGDRPQGYVLPLDEISPLYGKSWREIGLDAFANHRSQGITGFLGSPFLRRPIALKREDGGEVDPAILAEPLGPLDEDYEIGNKAVDPLMRAVDTALVSAREAAERLDWKAATDSLVAAGRKLDQIPLPAAPYEVPAPAASLARSAKRKRENINAALILAAGVRLEALADRSELVSGEAFTLRVDTHRRQEISGDFRRPKLDLPPNWKVVKEEPEAGGSLRFTIAIPHGLQVPQDGSESLLSSLRNSASAPAAPFEALLPEPLPLLTVSQEAVVGGYSFTATAPFSSVHATSTRIDKVTPRLVPAYTIAVEPTQAIEILDGKPTRSFEVRLRVHSYATQPANVTVGLDAPRLWNVSAPVPLKFDGTGDRYARFTVKPPAKLGAGNLKIAAHVYKHAGSTRSVRDAKFTTSLEPLPTMPTQLWSEPAECVVRAFSIDVPQNLHVGYITAESEPIPDALRMLGIQVDMLDAQALAFGDLSKLDAIVVGVRAYELRSDLPGANQRLLDYTSKGGTLIVQYQRDFAWDRYHYAPFPAQISPTGPAGREETIRTPRPLPRITDENSPVKFMKSADPLLNHPNKITPSDFEGWVQERGLYFWTQFDRKYTPLLAMNDPGEPDLNGALVYAHYGKGTYIYTGIAFFRQLPEGVPGAYRLFVNLLSASRNLAPEPAPKVTNAKRH
jgi:LmbE family N-acetylglucosaminyl deacetylase